MIVPKQQDNLIGIWAEEPGDATGGGRKVTRYGHLSLRRHHDWRQCARELDAGEFSGEVETYCKNRDELLQIKKPIA